MTENHDPNHSQYVTSKKIVTYAPHMNVKTPIYNLKVKKSNKLEYSLTVNKTFPANMNLDICNIICKISLRY